MSNTSCICIAIGKKDCIECQFCHPPAGLASVSRKPPPPILSQMSDCEYPIRSAGRLEAMLPRPADMEVYFKNGRLSDAVFHQHGMSIDLENPDHCIMRQLFDVVLSFGALGGILWRKKDGGIWPLIRSVTTTASFVLQAIVLKYPVLAKKQGYDCTLRHPLFMLLKKTRKGYVYRHRPFATNIGNRLEGLYDAVLQDVMKQIGGLENRTGNTVPTRDFSKVKLYCQWSLNVHRLYNAYKDVEFNNTKSIDQYICSPGQRNEGQLIDDIDSFIITNNLSATESFFFRRNGKRQTVPLHDFFGLEDGNVTDAVLDRIRARVRNGEAFPVRAFKLHPNDCNSNQDSIGFSLETMSDESNNEGESDNESESDKPDTRSDREKRSIRRKQVKRKMSEGNETSIRQPKRRKQPKRSSKRRTNLAAPAEVGKMSDDRNKSKEKSKRQPKPKGRKQQKQRSSTAKKKKMQGTSTEKSSERQPTRKAIYDEARSSRTLRRVIETGRPPRELTKEELEDIAMSPEEFKDLPSNQVIAVETWMELGTTDLVKGPEYPVFVHQKEYPDYNGADRGPARYLSDVVFAKQSPCFAYGVFGLHLKPHGLVDATNAFELVNKYTEQAFLQNNPEEIQPKIHVIPVDNPTTAMQGEYNPNISILHSTDTRFRNILSCTKEPLRPLALLDALKDLVGESRSALRGGYQFSFGIGRRGVSEHIVKSQENRFPLLSAWPVMIGLYHEDGSGTPDEKKKKRVVAEQVGPYAEYATEMAANFMRSSSGASPLESDIRLHEGAGVVNKSLGIDFGATESGTVAATICGLKDPATGKAISVSEVPELNTKEYEEELATGMKKKFRCDDDYNRAMEQMKKQIHQGFAQIVLRHDDGDNGCDPKKGDDFSVIVTSYVKRVENIGGRDLDVSYRISVILYTRQSVAIALKTEEHINALVTKRNHYKHEWNGGLAWHQIHAKDVSNGQLYVCDNNIGKSYYGKQMLCRKTQPGARELSWQMVSFTKPCWEKKGNIHFQDVTQEDITNMENLWSSIRATWSSGPSQLQNLRLDTKSCEIANVPMHHIHPLYHLVPFTHFQELSSRIPFVSTYAAAINKFQILKPHSEKDAIVELLHMSNLVVSSLLFVAVLEFWMLPAEKQKCWVEYAEQVQHTHTFHIVPTWSIVESGTSYPFGYLSQIFADCCHFFGEKVKGGIAMRMTAQNCWLRRVVDVDDESQKVSNIAFNRKQLASYWKVIHWANNMKVSEVGHNPFAERRMPDSSGVWEKFHVDGLGPGCSLGAMCILALTGFVTSENGIRNGANVSLSKTKNAAAIENLMTKYLGIPTNDARYKEIVPKINGIIKGAASQIAYLEHKNRWAYATAEFEQLACADANRVMGQQDSNEGRSIRSDFLIYGYHQLDIRGTDVMMLPFGSSSWTKYSLEELKPVIWKEYNGKHTGNPTPVDSG